MKRRRIWLCCAFFFGVIDVQTRFCYFPLPSFSLSRCFCFVYYTEEMEGEEERRVRRNLANGVLFRNHNPEEPKGISAEMTISNLEFTIFKRKNWNLGWERPIAIGFAECFWSGRLTGRYFLKRTFLEHNRVFFKTKVK